MFGLLVLVGLFVALTPGILFRLKGSKKVSAAAHAVLFGLVLYVVCMYGPSYGVSIEGFQNSGCPGGTTFDPIRNKCKAMVAGNCTSGVVGANGMCVRNKQIVGQPFCPTYADSPTADNNGMCTVYAPSAAEPGVLPAKVIKSPLVSSFGPNEMIYCNNQSVPLKVITMPSPTTVQLDIPGQPTISASLCTRSPPTVLGTIISAITGKK